MKKAHVFLIALGILVIAGVSITSLIVTNKADHEDRFAISGSGTVYAKADIANISVGVRTEVRPTAAEATKENTNKMNEILSVLKDLEIESKDIKTSSYSLNPSYTWTEKDGQKLRGYEVYQSVTLKVRDLDKIGDIIAKTTEKGANQVGSITFTIDDEFDLRNEARKMAIEKAKEKALLIAEQTGMKLGDIKGMYESASSPVMPYDYSNAREEMLMADEAASGISAPAIEAGQNEIKVEVTLTYEIK